MRLRKTIVDFVWENKKQLAKIKATCLQTFKTGKQHSLNFYPQLFGYGIVYVPKYKQTKRNLESNEFQKQFGNSAKMIERALETRPSGIKLLMKLDVLL